MDALPNEILFRIVVRLADTKAFFTIVPLVCRRFNRVQSDIRKASTVSISIVISNSYPSLSVKELKFVRHTAQLPSTKTTRLRRQILQFSPGSKTWKTHVLRNSGILLSRDGLEDTTADDVATALQAVLEGVLPFGHVKFSDLNFKPDGLPISWIIELANHLSIDCVNFDEHSPYDKAPRSPKTLEECLLDEADAIKLLRSTDVTLEGAPFSMIYLFPHVQTFGGDLSGLNKSMFHTQQGIVRQHPNLETLRLGAIADVEADGIACLAEAILAGAFPRLRNIECGFMAQLDEDGDYRYLMEEYDVENDPATPSILALKELLHKCPSVSATIVGDQELDSDAFQQFHIDEDESAPSARMVLDTFVRKPRVVLECTAGGGFCVYDGTLEMLN
ncbi:hypothetical protein M427DRAFT_72036 [Gonapodya prolifera JEL478]|uniref:F-box domain-containing protein n=1 Tax=Gonapodya prolifera (strain JEL478) TaxID=1344416 RepID=A0A139A6Q8_GONPJ|nr:hypothetical protein M427DRAFT_72036 [Gonapodya prolifera JEL478]|eukprot:KXS12384.1 hypothetical protein M427DRAFT_72036 [Gonapodya prolifera JEL478]